MRRQAPTLKTLRPMVASLDVRVAAPAPKEVDPYYGSAAHREWRRVVIGRAGGRCQDPGCDAPARTGRRLYADHVKELRDGGAATDPANGMARCAACHTRKTNAARAARMGRRT